MILHPLHFCYKMPLRKGFSYLQIFFFSFQLSPPSKDPLLCFWITNIFEIDFEERLSHLIYETALKFISHDM